MMWLWGKIQGWAAAVGLIAVALGVAFFKGRSAGIQHIESEQTKRRLEALKDRKAVDDEVANLGSNDLDQSLARWMRDDKR